MGDKGIREVGKRGRGIKEEEEREKGGIGGGGLITFLYILRSEQGGLARDFASIDCVLDLVYRRQEVHMHLRCSMI